MSTSRTGSLRARPTTRQTHRSVRQRAGPLRFVGPPRPGPLPKCPSMGKTTTHSTYEWRKIGEQVSDAATSLAWFTNNAISKIESQLYPRGFPDWDQLLGLYYGDYLRRSEGVDAELYKQDKDAFKRKFGEYMDDQVERDREGYLRRLLSDIVENRKRLPIFV